MAHKQGIISKVYHNYNDKLGKPLPNDKINHKFYIGDEIFIIKGKYIPDFIKEGKKVSFAYSIWSPLGADKAFNFVQSENNTLKIQELKEQIQPDTSFDPEELEAQLQEITKDSKNGLAVEKKSFNKDEYMFVMAMCKSALESKGIECNKESIDIFIKQMKLVYKYNF
jgi:hypothetical protein